MTRNGTRNAAERPYAARLALARELLAAFRSQPPPRELVDALAPAVAAAVQGARETHWFLVQAAQARAPELRGRVVGDRAVAWETMARALAALLVPGVEVCAHLRREPLQPALVLLAVRRVCCRRCVATVRRPPADEADRCDWCGARGVSTFTPVAATVGALVTIGDACAACAEALIPDSSTDFT